MSKRSDSYRASIKKTKKGAMHRPSGYSKLQRAVYKFKDNWPPARAEDAW